MFIGFRDKKYLGIASQDWTLKYRIYHITKVRSRHAVKPRAVQPVVRSRQAVKLPAVQPIVMWMHHWCTYLSINSQKSKI